MTVAVLGPGAVGSAIAARVASTGARVVCVATARTAAAIRERGVLVETPHGRLHARPEAVEYLQEPVSLLVVAVKAPALAEALERVQAYAVADGVVVPLLNGLEHPVVIRRRLGARVAPGTISRFNGELLSPAHALERSDAPHVGVALGDIGHAAVAAAVAPLQSGGIDVSVEDDERALLWRKAARLAVLAAATTATGLTIGALRADPAERRRLDAALEDAIRVARSDGVELSSAAAWEIIDGMPPDATTSTALDAASGRPSELDAITGAVLRVAAHHHVECPALEALLREAEAACRT